ncbi:MAG: trypsin-like peptidase domain-containing protein, partial [Thiohalocapsa sp.]
MRHSTQIAVIYLSGFVAGAVLAASLMLGEIAMPSQTEAMDSEGDGDLSPPRSYANAVNRAAPAVVTIYGNHPVVRELPRGVRPGQSPAPFWAQGEHGRGQTSLGSGVLVSDQGLLVTNRHVIEGATSVRAELPGGQALSVELLGVDTETDLAVFQAVDANLPVLEIGDPAALRVGDVVLAIGNPFGIGQTVSMGIVSATGRANLGLTGIENFIQTDAAINPGNSGGPLVDATGRLVGINTAILSESGLSEGVGFAIPANVVMRVALDIAASGGVERGWLGIAGRSLTPSLAERFGLRAPNGVLVTSVRQDGPAATAGLRT